MKKKKKIHRPSLIISLSAFAVLILIFPVMYQSMLLAIVMGLIVMILGIIGLTLAIKAKGDYRYVVAFVLSIINTILGLLAIFAVISVLLIVQLGDPPPNYSVPPDTESDTSAVTGCSVYCTR